MCYLDNLKDNGNCNTFVVSPLGDLCWLWVEIAVYLLRIFSILFVRVFVFKLEVGAEFCEMFFWQL